jgi:OOP family OmpA-OmpF porin
MNMLTPFFFAAGVVLAAGPALPLPAAAQTATAAAAAEHRGDGAPTGDRLELALNLVFAFDRSWRSDIPEADRDQLDAVLSTVANRGLRVVVAKVTGHADRLDGTGDRVYNLRLSERRAATVRALLVERGVDAKVIDVAAAGDSGQSERCVAKTAAKAALAACLQPNRRVEVVLVAVREQ